MTRPHDIPEWEWDVMQKQADQSSNRFPTYIPGRWDEKTTDQKIDDAIAALDKAWTHIRRLEEMNESLAEINNEMFFQMLGNYEDAPERDRTAALAKVTRQHLASLGFKQPGVS